MFFRTTLCYPKTLVKFRWGHLNGTPTWWGVTVGSMVCLAVSVKGRMMTDKQTDTKLLHIPGLHSNHSCGNSNYKHSVTNGHNNCRVLLPCICSTLNIRPPGMSHDVLFCGVTLPSPYCYCISIGFPFIAGLTVGDQLIKNNFKTNK